MFYRIFHFHMMANVHLIDAFVEAYYTISRLVLIIKSCKLNTGIILRFWTQILRPLKLLG